MKYSSEQLAWLIRRHAVELTHLSGGSHIGSILSVADIIAVLYTGVTSNLVKRIYEHKNKLIPSFTNNYNINKLVYYEVSDSILSAIEREKQIKGKKRVYKENLINNFTALSNNFTNLFRINLCRDNLGSISREHFSGLCNSLKHYIV